MLEQDLVANLNEKPQLNYTFAFKRVAFEDISMSFMFENEDLAKNCIQVVSTLYKRLKQLTKKKDDPKQSVAAQTNNTKRK